MVARPAETASDADLQRIRKQINDLFVGQWVRKNAEVVAALKLPSSARRRREASFKPWNEVLDLLAMAERATDRKALIETWELALTKMAALDEVPEAQRLSVLSAVRQL